MIFLIGGTAKSGKTYLANKILKEKTISYFSTDYLMVTISNVLKINVDEEDDKMVAHKLSPFLETMIEAMIYNKIDYLIEGVHLLPEFVSKLINKYPKYIKSCFLGYTDIAVNDKIDELMKYQSENCWYKHYSHEQMKQLVNFLHHFSQEIKNDCLSYSIPYFEIKNIVNDYELIIDYLFTD